MPFHPAKPLNTPFTFRFPELDSTVPPPSMGHELQAFLQAERVRMANTLTDQASTYIEQEVALQLSAEFDQRVQEEVARQVATEVARQVATEVARQVQKFLEESRLARHKMFGASSEAHIGQGQLFNEAEALAALDLGDDVDQEWPS